MKLAASLTITFIALKTQKTRTFLASLGIMIGIASVIVMVGIGKGSEKEVMQVIAGMGENLIRINAGEMKRRSGRLRLSGEVTTMSLRDAVALKEEVGQLDKVIPFEIGPKILKYGSYSAQMLVSGSTPDFQEVRNYRVDKGTFFTERDVKLASRVAVIGQTTVENVFGEEDPLGKTLRVNSIPFKVIGVFVPKGLDTDGVDLDDIFVMPITTLLRRVLNQNYIRFIYAKAVSRRDIEPATAKIRDLLRSRHKVMEDAEDDFTITSQLDIEDLKRETSELFTQLIVGVAAISLVVGGIGILAVMLISVKERTREIGTRRAVGATKGDIVQQFLLESVVIGILGGAVGVSFGVGLTLGLDKWGPWTLVLDQSTILLASGVCFVIGVLFGVFPAIKASRLDPMTALTVE